jgi:hypothetical protein
MKNFKVFNNSVIVDFSSSNKEPRSLAASDMVALFLSISLLLHSLLTMDGSFCNPEIITAPTTENPHSLLRKK